MRGVSSTGSVTAYAPAMKPSIRRAFASRRFAHTRGSGSRSLSLGSLGDFRASPKMNFSILALGLVVLLSACSQTPKRHTNNALLYQERASDRYSRQVVKSYELFETHLADHAIMLVLLTTGEQFPMLCRKTSSGIYPIPQSVFPEQPSAKRWHIMCEPQIHNAYALTRLELSRVDGVLFMGERKLKPTAKVPLLSAPSL